MSHEAQTSFYFLSLMCVKRTCVRMCFVYFWTACMQVLSASFGVIFWGRHFYTLMNSLCGRCLEVKMGYSRNVWQFYIEILHSKHTFFSTYNFIWVPRSKNLFWKILARSGFRDFALFLVFWKMFLVFWGVFQVFWGVFLVFWGCSGFSRGCSGF